MSASTEKDLLVTQLIRETVSGSIVWQVLTPPYSLCQATENVVPLYLECQYKGARIGVYEVRQKNFTDVDEYYWSENLGICIVNEQNIVVWQAEEYSPALRELFQMVRHQASGIRNILGL